MLKCGKVSEKCKTNLLGSHSFHIFGDSHHLPGRQVDISLLDLLQICDELGERVPVDHQALHLPLRVSCVCDDVGCPHLKAQYEISVSYFLIKLDLLSTESFLSEEVALVQISDELVLSAATLLHRHLHSIIFKFIFHILGS